MTKWQPTYGACATERLNGPCRYFDGNILASFISLAASVAVSGLENILRTQNIN
jgi:hypothetical protein